MNKREDESQAGSMVAHPCGIGLLDQFCSQPSAFNMHHASCMHMRACACGWPYRVPYRTVPWRGVYTILVMYGDK